MSTSRTILRKVRRRVSRLVFDETRFETHFNTPVRFDLEGAGSFNERIVEWPFVLARVGDGAPPKKVLDFGCTRSWLSLALASLGHSVHGVDLRPFPFTHPNFQFFQQDIRQLDADGFDHVISVSTLEHVGLGAYGENRYDRAVPQILQKVHAILKPEGELLLTVPVGQSSIDDFERSFAPEELVTLVSAEGFLPKVERYFRKEDQARWRGCTAEEIARVSNRPEDRGSGANGVGCFVFGKA